MLISLILLAMGASAASTAGPINSEPVILICPTEFTTSSPIGQSCAVKVQAVAISEILVPANKAKFVVANRYRAVDGKIVDESGQVVGLASPCLLPTAKPEADLPVVNKLEPDSANLPAGAVMAVQQCDTERFMTRTLSPVAG